MVFCPRKIHDFLATNVIPSNRALLLRQAPIAFIIILIILPLSSAYNLNYSIEKHQDAISESKINYPDDIYEWQDDTNSSWIGPYPSGETVTANHTWTAQGIYTIKAKAKDINEFESDWTTLEISMPRNKPLTNPLFLQFLERLMQRFPLLARLLQLPVFEKLII